MIKAVFIDRDGTLVDEPHTEVVDTWDKFVVKHDVHCLNDLQQAGYKLFIISNQEGINDGRLDTHFYQATNKRLLNKLREYSIKIEDIYTCPHAISENCHCRKPKIGLLDMALKRYKILFNKSWVIGDRATDVEFAYACGMKSVLIQSAVHKLGAHQPNFVASDLSSAVKFILGNYEAVANKS